MSVIESAPKNTQSCANDVLAVDVCICTFHRPAIVEALRSVSQQDGCDSIRIRVIVADNAAHPDARTLVESTARELGLETAYIHAPAHNISVARNACLDAARGEWLAFLDDDEVASPGWLNALISEAKRGQWDAVLGPVRAIYSSSTPAWIRAGNFHSTQPVFVQGRIETGYTGNVLIRRTVIERERLKFRAELGLSGGEDEDFFNRLRDVHGRIGFAPAAIAYEAIPEERATLAWLVRRSFRSGQTYGGRLHGKARNMPARGKDILVAAAKAGVCLLAALTHLPLPTRRNRFLTRAALHCGVVARLMGVTEVRLY